MMFKLLTPRVGFEAHIKYKTSKLPLDGLYT